MCSSTCCPTGKSKLSSHYIPYESTLERCAAHYSRMLEKLQADNPSHRLLYHGENAHFDEFIAKCNEELLHGLEVVS